MIVCHFVPFLFVIVFCLSFFDFRIFTTALISSISPYIFKMVHLIFIVLNIFTFSFLLFGGSKIQLRRVNTTLYDKVCKCMTCGKSVVFSWYSGFLHDITEILFKVALSTINHANHKPKKGELLIIQF
jgi:hypothetical protein